MPRRSCTSQRSLCKGEFRLATRSSKYEGEREGLRGRDILPDASLGVGPGRGSAGIRWESEIVGEVEVLFPVDDFAVGVVGVFGAERGPAYEAFEHNCAYGPPIATIGVALAAEDFWSNVVWSPHCRVGEDTARLAPGVNLAAVADCEVDLVEGDGLAVFALLILVRAGLEEFLVVGIVVFFEEAGREAEIGKFDVAAIVEKDVVRLDVPKEDVSNLRYCVQDTAYL